LLGFGDDRVVKAWSSADQKALARSVFRRRWLIGLEREGVRTVGELRAMSEEQLQELWNVGPKTIADISEALADGTLRPDDPLWCLELSAAGTIAERDEELIRMRQQGASLGQIAGRFGISRERVRQILNREGW